ncbi:MAG: hypothetical protein QE274_09425, partial [Verrucomicrobiaceae bacterium]|nr:hypothetical protein [Verrucomicrobiaceae bacterium]
AVLFWALSPTGDEGGWEAGSVSGEVVAGGRVTMLGGAVERDYGNARLDLEVRVRNEGVHPLVMKAPKVRLMAGEREVPTFFLPAERLPEVAAKTTSEVTLRFWLEAADLKGALVLDVEGEKVPVKSAAVFDLTTLENGKPRAVRGVEW